MQGIQKILEWEVGSEMGKITYNLDSVVYVKNDIFQGIAIDGWAFDDSGQAVDVTLKGEYNFLWYRTARKDVTDYYKQHGQTEFVGFHLETMTSGRHSTLILSLKAGEHSEEVKIDLEEYCPGLEAYRRFAAQVCHTERVVDLFRMRVSENVCYRIENLWYDSMNDNIFISGWAFDRTGTDVVSLAAPEGEKIRVSRQDVKEYYEARGIDAMCGFEIKIPGKASVDCIRLAIGTSDDRYILNLDMDMVRKILNGNKPVPASSFHEKWSRKMKQLQNVWKYGEAGANLKDREYQIFLQESNLNRAPYRYEEPQIPEQWIQLQKKQPDISVIIPLRNTPAVAGELNLLLKKLEVQSYQNFRLLFCGAESDLKGLPQTGLPCSLIPCKDSDKKEDCIWKGISSCETEFFTVMDQEDLPERHCLFTFVENISLNPDKALYYADYDVCYQGEPLFPVKRLNHFRTESPGKILTAVLVETKFAKYFKSLEHFLSSVREMKEERTGHIERITYHFNAVYNQWDQQKSRVIAFYLPQFHENPENNKWWGQGFTEWVNVKRAYPMFEGHNQPRVPADLGYYNLVEDKTAQQKQTELAFQYDIFGFCFYYYWFEGKRLLRKPLDQYVENHNLKLPYCICWANETWSRRWNGAEKDILMQQVHNEKTDRAFIYDVIPMFKDERYIRVDGKPLLLIYRIELFPRPAKTINLWKKICRKEGIGEIHVALVQAFGMVDHRIYGADSSVEFPPHKIIGGTINDRVLSEEMKQEYTGNIYSYKEIVSNQMVVQKRDYNLWAGSMLNWDNTARRLKAANVFHEFSPELYRKWMIKNHIYTQLYHPEPYMFVNAWNEWAEGTYLEPDEKYGCQLLEITKEVVNYK